MPRHEAFSVEIPVGNDEAMEKFQEAMNDYQDEMDRMVREEAEKIGVSVGVMYDVWYLRSRSRWTQEKEDYLIKLAKEGKELPNVLAGEF